MNTTELQLRYSNIEYTCPPAGGHAACSGCGAVLALRYFLKSLAKKVVLVSQASCILVILRTFWDGLSFEGESIPRMQAPFGLAGTHASGLKAGLKLRGDMETEVVAFSGDGATMDLGLANLAGIAERNEDIIYVCYDNEAYMNTGNQRSSSTPPGVITATTPAHNTKIRPKKDIMTILSGTNIPYAATATVAYPDDFMQKVKKARDIKGFRFFYVFTPCPTGWRYPSELTIELSRLAVQSKAFPLFEIENGLDYTINKEPKGIPVQEYIKDQGRFRYITPRQVTEFQESVDRRWERLQALAGRT